MTPVRLGRKQSVNCFLPKRKTDLKRSLKSMEYFQGRFWDIQNGEEFTIELQAKNFIDSFSNLNTELKKRYFISKFPHLTNQIGSDWEGMASDSAIGDRYRLIEYHPLSGCYGCRNHRSGLHDHQGEGGCQEL